MDNLEAINVTPEIVYEQTLFCIKDVNSPGFENKRRWFETRYKEGMRMKILRDETNRSVAFIEYIPAEFAWRPVDADGFMFIHCMYVYSNKDKNQGIGSILVNLCEEDARERRMSGIAVMTSKGSWTADKRLFVNNGFKETDRLGRFELMVKKFDSAVADPRLINWTEKQNNYTGWHLLYANQCPWHEKSVQAIKKTAKDAGISLTIRELTSAEEAKRGPSGFGVFSLLFDGKLLEDHYISQTRFKSILKKELGEN